MANHITLTGRAVEIVIDKSETLHMLLEIRTSADLAHVKVTTDDPQVVNQFRQYSSRPVYVCGELRSDTDGSFVRFRRRA